MKKAAAELLLANDFIFGEVVRQPENVKPLLEAVLEKKIAGTAYIEKQQDIRDGITCIASAGIFPWRTAKGHSTPWKCRPAAPMAWSVGSGITRVPGTANPGGL